MLLSRAGYLLVRLLKVNKDKRSEKEGSGNKKTQMIYQVDYTPLQKDHELI